MTTRLVLTNIEGFLVKKATRFGNGAKVDCPKQYLGKTVYLVVLKNEPRKSDTKNKQTRKRKQGT